MRKINRCIFRIIWKLEKRLILKKHCQLFYIYIYVCVCVCIYIYIYKTKSSYVSKQCKRDQASNTNNLIHQGKKHQKTKK